VMLSHNRPSNMSKQDDGFVLILAVLTLLLVTLIGLFATGTTSIELKISGNEKSYIQNFYRAEAAAMEAAKRIRLASQSVLQSRSTSWLNSSAFDPINGDWTDTNSLVVNWPGVPPSASVRFCAVDRGVAQGSSLSMESSTVHLFDVYGQSLQSGGRVLIQLGFRRRF